MAKIVQTEGRTSSLLECYAEVQPIFCKDTKKIETTIPFNSIFLFSTQRLSIRGGNYPHSALPLAIARTAPTKQTIFSHRMHKCKFMGCTCLRSTLPLARARSAPTKQYTHQHYNPPTEHAEPTEPSGDKTLPQIAQMCTD